MCSVLRNYPKSEMMILEVIIYNVFLFFWSGTSLLHTILSFRRFEDTDLNLGPIILVETGKYSNNLSQLLLEFDTPL